MAVTQQNFPGETFSNYWRDRDLQINRLENGTVVVAICNFTTGISMDFLIDGPTVPDVVAALQGRPNRHGDM